MTESHPTARQLAAYQAGQLSPGEEDKIQEHLTACRECTGLLLSFPEFQELMEAEDLEAAARLEEIPSPSETQASWQAVRARLTASRPAPPPPRVSRFRRLTTSPTTVLALAASLLACLIGFPLWIATHGGSAGAPVAVYPLGGGEVTRGTRDSGEPFTMSLAEAPAVLTLPLPPRAAFPSYRVEVWTPGGELRLSAKVLPVATAPGSAERPPRLVALVLARGQLAAGDYRLRLVGERGAHGEVLAEHALRVPAF